MRVDEDGSAAGGYAKEMSPEWFAAAEQMLLKECADAVSECYLADTPCV